MISIMSKTNTGSNSNEYYIEVTLTGVKGHNSSPGSTGKLSFHLVGRLGKRVNS
jgi:hypothetical protein